MSAKQVLFGESAHARLVAMGVLDPCKVTRSALQNAASIAGLILTTDCMIAQLPARTPAGAPEMEAA